MMLGSSLASASLAHRVAGPGRRLLADRRGGALLEFAFCTPPFIALLVACAQLALLYFAQQGIQTSAEIMARKLMTGEVRQSSTTAAQFKQAACLTLPPYMRCSKLVVDARQATSFAGIDTAMPTYTFDAAGNVTNAQYSTGTAGSIVILRLVYPWSVINGPLGLNLGNQPDGRHLLFGTMVFKSEPYQ